MQLRYPLTVGWTGGGGGGDGVGMGWEAEKVLRLDNIHLWVVRLEPMTHGSREHMCPVL